MKNTLLNKELIRYVARFLGGFTILFYGTEAVIGLSAPDNNYNAFVDQYLDFITPFRYLLLRSAGALLSLFSINTGITGEVISWEGGKSLRMSYSCIGYGVLSFWVAFVWANRLPGKIKWLWILGGSLVLCFINILRVSLLLVAVNRGWAIPLGWDHHTWFNIICYVVIFGMIYCFDRSVRKEAGKKKHIPANTGSVTGVKYYNKQQEHSSESKMVG